MAASNDPNSTPSMPAIFPPWLDKIQIKYMNPVMKRVSRFMPGASVIKHRGRKSGKPYETVVTTFRKGNLLAIALGHGKADWVRNVLAAGEADIRLFRQEIHITNPRIIPVGAADSSLPRVIRMQNNRVAVLVADIT